MSDSILGGFHLRLDKAPVRSTVDAGPEQRGTLCCALDFVVVRPGAPSSVLAPSSDGLQPSCIMSIALSSSPKEMTLQLEYVRRMTHLYLSKEPSKDMSIWTSHCVLRVGTDAKAETLVVLHGFTLCWSTSKSFNSLSF